VIYQYSQKIEVKKIIEREFFPVWFFTNEKGVAFLKRIDKKNKFNRIFAVGGGGDFIFNFLSLFEGIKSSYVCDIRQLANISIDIKKAIIKKTNTGEVKDIFENYKSENKLVIYNLIKKDISPESRKIISTILKKREEKNFIKALYASKYWYKESFLRFKNKEKYISYFSSREHALLKEQIKGINILCGDFNDNLKKFEDNYFDLIYTSNIFDSKDYCLKEEDYIATIKEKLKNNGIFIVVTQKSYKKRKRDILKKGFISYIEEVNRFNPLTAVLGDYNYSFLAFKKNQ